MRGLNKTFLLATLATAGLITVQASATVLFSDNFEAQPDGDTAAVYQGGTANDTNGDADPSAPSVGSWTILSEQQPWYTQVSTATNGPAPGPAGGTGKYLITMRNNDPAASDARANLVAGGTGQVDVNFQLAMATDAPAGTGGFQFFVRDATGGGFSALPAYVDLSPDGTVKVNGATTSLTFDKLSPRYTSVDVLIDVPAQRYTLSINGNTSANSTNIAFDPGAGTISSIQQLGFYVNDFGTFGIDNVVAQSVPEPASAGLLLVAGGLLARRGRRLKR